jgi:hypothetical protein
MLDYNLQWRSHHFWITVSSAVAISQLQSAVHYNALDPIGLLYHTSPLVPASNDGPFLGSQSVPIPQPQQLTVRSPVIDSAVEVEVTL